MAAAQELLRIFRMEGYQDKYTYAKASSTCIRCGHRVDHFRDSYSRMEYGISALCQDCQDHLFQAEDGKSGIFFMED